MVKWIIALFKKKKKETPHQVMAACEQIVDYYVDKFQGDEAAIIDHIYNLRIELIEFKGGAILIHTHRPGMLIGKMGRDYDGLKSKLGEFKIIEIREPSYTDILVSTLCRRKEEAFDRDYMNADYKERREEFDNADDQRYL